MNEPPIKPNRQWPGPGDLACEPITKPSSIKHPVNRAQATVRVILWLLPTGFAVLSAMGSSWLKIHGYLPRWHLAACLIPNVIFVVGAGWYNALLSTKARG